MASFRDGAARRRPSGVRLRMRRGATFVARLLSAALLIFAVFGSPRLVGAIASATDSVGCCPHDDDTEDGKKQCCCGTHARSDQFFSSGTSCSCGATQGAFVAPAVASALQLVAAPLAIGVATVEDPSSLHGRLDHVRIERPPRA